MAAAATPRARLARKTSAPRPAPVPAPIPVPSAAVTERRSSAVMWVLLGVPVLLALTLAWQLGSSFIHIDSGVREPASVGRVSLEADPAGSRIDMVLVDRVGQETTTAGTVSVKLREPDGTLWQASRAVTASDFGPLPDGGLLAGRTGYAIVVPSSDWARPPRHGGTATVSVTVQPNGGGAALSTVAEELFP